MKPEILVHDMSPHGNAEAFVEDDGRVVYLYLRGVGQQMKSVWVANRGAAPSDLDVAGMREGIPPLRPTAHCREQQDSVSIEPSRLGLVWLEAGDGVALFQDGELIAAIPPWSGQGGFYGYAANAVGDGPLAWELRGDNEMHGRFAAARKSWSLWDVESNPWQRIQAEQIEALAVSFGAHHKYFAIDGNAWPPKALLWFRTATASILTTVGVGLRPMPLVELDVDCPRAHRRVELGAVLPPSAPEAQVLALARYIGAQSSLPWDRHTWLGHGHTIPCDALVDIGRTAVVLQSASESAVACPLPDFEGDPVRMLWMIPISDEELAVARAEGSQAVLSTITIPRVEQ